MDYGWLNIGSLLFGLIAIIIPIIKFIMQDKSDSKNLGILPGISISACAISLCMQILYANHLVNIQDWTALMDLTDTVAKVSVGLLIATITLNIITYITYNRKKSQI
ncbi:MAG: hypothetical protein RR894_18730 [Terrisporobacter sp.]